MTKNISVVKIWVWKVGLRQLDETYYHHLVCQSRRKKEKRMICSIAGGQEKSTSHIHTMYTKNMLYILKFFSILFTSCPYNKSKVHAHCLKNVIIQFCKCRAYCALHSHRCQIFIQAQIKWAVNVKVCYCALACLASLLGECQLPLCNCDKRVSWEVIPVGEKESSSPYFQNNIQYF